MMVIAMIVVLVLVMVMMVWVIVMMVIVVILVLAVGIRGSEAQFPPGSVTSSHGRRSRTRQTLPGGGTGVAGCALLGCQDTTDGLWPPALLLYPGTARPRTLTASVVSDY